MKEITIRFIIKQKTRIYGKDFDKIKTTTSYSELASLLVSGGFSADGDFDCYELIGAEVVSKLEQTNEKHT